MKKSFLSRAMSAAIAVPVALSQTILCASFAVDDTASESETKTITIEDFKQVPVKDTNLSPITEVEKYVKYEKTSTWNNSLEGWTNTLMGQKVALNASRLANAISSQAWYAEILKEAMSNPEYASAEAEIGLDNITVTVNVNYPYSAAMNNMFEKKFAEKYPDIDMTFESEGVLSGTVVLTASTEALGDSTIPFDVKFIPTEHTEKDSMSIDGLFNYVENMLENAREDATKAVDNKVKEYQAQKDAKQAELDDAVAKLNAKKAELAEKLAELEAKKQDLDQAQADLEAAEAAGEDTTSQEAKLNEAQQKYDNAVQQADEAQAKVDDADQQAADAQKKLDDAQAQLDDAEAMAKGEIDNLVDTYLTKIQNSRNRVNKLKDSYSKEYTGATIDDIIQQAKADADRVAPSQSNRIDRIPDSIDELADTNIYAQLAKIFTETLTQINEQAAVKAYEVDLNANDILDLAKEMYDITVTGAASKDAQGYGVANGTAVGSLPETLTEDDLAYYYDYFNDLFAADNKKVVEDSIKTEKVVEASGNMVSDTMTGEVTLQIKRVITLEVEDLDETTTSSSEDPSSTTTSSSEDPSSTTTSSSEDPSSTTTSSSVDPSSTTTSSSDVSQDGTTTSSSDVSQDGTTTSSSDVSQDGTTTSSSDQKQDETTTSSSDQKQDETTTSSSDQKQDETTTSSSDQKQDETTTSSSDQKQDGTTTSSSNPNQDETTTSSSDPNPTETTTTNPGDIVKDIHFDVDGNVDGNKNFYFSHDPRPFQVADLVRSATMKEVVEVDGQKVEQEVPVDMSKITFGLDSSAPDANLNPAAIVAKLEAAGQEFAYTLTPLYIFYDGYVADTQVYIYIGVKGDTNLDGRANATDAGKVLVYAAAIGSGQQAHLTSENAGEVNQALEAFAWFLSDIDTESRDKGVTSNAESDEPATVNAKDAASILVYAAAFGVKGDAADWVTDVLNPNNDSSVVLPKFTKEIFDWKAQNV